MQDATALVCGGGGGLHGSGGGGGGTGGGEVGGAGDAAAVDDGGGGGGGEPYEPLVDDGGELDSASYELIYGLPRSLLVLVHRTCGLVRKMNRVSAAAVPPPPLMADICDALEDEILDWPVDAEVARLRRARVDESNSSILQHHIRAFHAATIVFFCRKVRLMNRRFLQRYVNGVVGHLVEIEAIKQREGISANPLLWPAFVAGAEAMESETRERLLGWFEVVERHGVATAKLTRLALEEMWRREDVGCGKGAAPVGVLNTQLMLT
ncbi:arginine metabolism regulation protein II [Diplodia intermedia]|uniref:Arginine metabolism regulation protein II n=1 Tax=Diplodia intermedia TaxID=856260 RepID=A0ABR3TJ63_9PEZI